MGYYHPQLVTIFTKATRLASAQRPVGDAKGWLDIFFTPPKTNMEPENELLEEEIPMKNHHF